MTLVVLIMKKNIKTIAMAAATLLMVSCGAGTTGLGTTGTTNNAAGTAVGGILSTVLGAATDGQTLGNVLFVMYDFILPRAEMAIAMKLSAHGWPVAPKKQDRIRREHDSETQ